MTWNVWGNLCKWKSPLCVCVHDCMHMHVHLGTGGLCVSGLWAVCKSQRLGWRENHRLIPQLFSQPFLFLDSPTAHKDLFTVHTRKHTHRPSGMQTNAHGKRPDNEKEFLLSCRQVSSEWVPAPRCTLSSQRTSLGDGEKLHTSSWKLDDCSMCSYLTGDP